MMVTDAMLHAAMKKAIEHGLVVRHQSTEEDVQSRQAMKEILQAAMDAS